MNRIKQFYLRLRYWNLIGTHHYTWFRYEDGREVRREYAVIAQSKKKRDQWHVRTDGGSLLPDSNGYYIRRCMTEKVIIDT